MSLRSQSVLRFLFRVVGLAVACLLTGWLASLCARPVPGGSDGLLIWPPVGIGLVGMLVGGRSLWPGLWTAAFALAVGSGFGVEVPSLERAGLAALAATAYTLQAAVGVWLVRRLVGEPTTLARFRDVAGFLLLAGPVHSVFAVSLVGVAAGADLSAVAQRWLADAAGGLVFGTVTLAVVGRPRAAWAPRRLTVAVPLLVTAGLVVVAGIATRRAACSAADERVQAEAGSAAVSLVAELDRVERGLKTLRACLPTSAFGDQPAGDGRAALRVQLQLLRRISPLIQSAEVDRSITCDERPAFEARLHDGEKLPAGTGRPIGVYELDPAGRPVPARDRNWYLAVAVADPPTGVYQGTGFDVLSDPGRRAVVEKAYQTNAPAAGRPACQAAGPSGTVFLAMPCYTSTRQVHFGSARQTVGVVSIHLDLGRVEAVLGVGRDPRVRFTLIDSVSGPPPPVPAGGRRVERPVQLADHSLTLVTTAPADLLPEPWGGSAGPVSAAGFSIAGLVAALLLTVTALPTPAAGPDAAARPLTDSAVARVERDGLFRQVFRSSEPGKAVLTPSGRFLHVNSALCDLLGRTEADLLATDFQAVTHPDDLAASLNRFRQSAVGDGSAEPYDSRCVHRDGRTVWVSRTERAVRNPDGSLASLAVQVHDVTARKRAEREQRSAEARSAEARRVESLGVLAGGVAHDFNNLLTGVLGNAGLVREVVPPDSELHDFLRPIEESAEQAARLCRQMLAYAGRDMTSPGPVELNRLVEEADDQLRAAAGSSLAYRFDPSPGLPVVTADADQLRQVVLTLVQNSGDALAGRDGSVTVATGAGGGPAAAAPGAIWSGEPPAGPHVWVDVTDTGPGMPPETARRVFDPFFTTRSLGRGLGLSAAQGIVRSLGGAIAVETAAGRGTRVRVFLPADGGAVVDPEPAADTALVMDRVPAIRSLAAVALRSLGFTVVEARDAREAVELLCDRPARQAVAVLDGADGWDVLRQARRFAPDLPAVLTGAAAGSHPGGWATDDRVRVLPKPFRVADLTACVRELVGPAAGPR